ncbi:MAG TPA: dipeptide epimerase [Steroidobacteraceae bacterium]|jgi:L-alanine-DL-glutamate epimerase-like enolase superfamily enzyme|nr:dipeptide epimerase [Steroidobacteraceae bacterium]
MASSGRLKLTVAEEHWPMKEPFAIAGYTFTDCDVIAVQLARDGAVGHGEGAGVYYHDETPAAMIAQIEQVRPALEAGIFRQELRELLPPGGARCALDSALWDLEAKSSGVPAYRTAGLDVLAPLKTTLTVSVSTPQKMAEVARSFALAPRLKVKMTGEDDATRLRAVRAARPDAWIGVDANQALTRSSLEALLPLLTELDISLIEQPVKIGHEEELRGLRSPIPLAADESVQSLADIERVAGLFDVVSIKLDKCGGLTEALEMAHEIRRRGMKVMVGCMQGTSLAIAPACVVGQLCEIVDLDAPVFLGIDRPVEAVYERGTVRCPDDWGFPVSVQQDRKGEKK